jgi:two-component system chemotaxis sensor kinase CheA
VNQLLEQFISETRESLQGISEKLMQLENDPDSSQLMTELFRYVHTLKGNSGLFDFPELTRVLHAGEDLMDAVREGRLPYSLPMADLLLDAMDFVGMLCDEIEKTGVYEASHAGSSVRLAELLRELIGVTPPPEATAGATPQPDPLPQTSGAALPLSELSEQVRMDAYRAAAGGISLHFLVYRPAQECFFQGDDPFYQARQTPGILWGGITARAPWPELAELDAYSCVLDFHLLSEAPLGELREYYRYVAEQLEVHQVPPQNLILPQGKPDGAPAQHDFMREALSLVKTGDLNGLGGAAQGLLQRCDADSWLASALRWLLLVAELEPNNGETLEAIIGSLGTLAAPDWQRVCGLPAAADQHAAALEGTAALTGEVRQAADAICYAQREILSLADQPAWVVGRIGAAAASLKGCLLATGSRSALPGLELALAAALNDLSGAPLLSWLDAFETTSGAGAQAGAVPPATGATAAQPEAALQSVPPEAEVKFGRRAEDAFTGAKSIKVDQDKIDRLMNLIGEMVVAKNALPYLAGRAENVFGVRELSREIKAQYAVINRIAEEMQDSIMQVRMMPVSFVFQRFPRLVRDISHKLGKEVNLVLEGEETEADKNIIESLGDPLIHIVRNSLDHGIESPELRLAAGKPAAGTLTIRASQEADRVYIEIRDDGKGIDPEVIKRKAYEKGVIDEDHLERITDQEAVNLVFAAGFSTAETISDLSGRGVGMDVVRTAIERVNGTVQLESEKGKGTRIRISLPLSMAVTNVMIVESNRQIFGVPMEAVVETVRVARSDIKTIKKCMAVVLRGRIVPLKSLNALLGLAAAHKANDEDELAVLVVNLGDAAVGILVDDFRETVDIILKPMAGVLSGLSAYSGSALLGDGSVLMVLNMKELL